MASNLQAMASNLLAMASNPIGISANLRAMASNLLAMSNLRAMASNLRAMASNQPDSDTSKLIAMASGLHLPAMASNLIAAKMDKKTATRCYVLSRKRRRWQVWKRILLFRNCPDQTLR